MEVEAHIEEKTGPQSEFLSELFGLSVHPHVHCLAPSCSKSLTPESFIVLGLGDSPML